MHLGQQTHIHGVMRFNSISVGIGGNDLRIQQSDRDSQRKNSRYILSASTS